MRDTKHCAASLRQQSYLYTSFLCEVTCRYTLYISAVRSVSAISLQLVVCFVIHLMQELQTASKFKCTCDDYVCCCWWHWRTANLVRALWRPVCHIAGLVTIVWLTTEANDRSRFKHRSTVQVCRHVIYDQLDIMTKPGLPKVLAYTGQFRWSLIVCHILSVASFQHPDR